MTALWTTWRRESAEHRSVFVLTLAALLGLSLGSLLFVAGMTLLGQLVAGLAVPSLMLALYLCLLPVGPWPEDPGDSGPGRRDDGPDVPEPGGRPEEVLDWDRFEREFRAYVDEHALVHPSALVSVLPT
jgi:hypothetical protein